MTAETYVLDPNGPVVEISEMLGRRAEQYAALEATAVALDDEDDLETTLSELRAARRATAAARRRTSPA